MIDVMGLLTNVVSLSNANLGFVQQPQFHQATSMGALLKHKRKLEDIILKAELDMTQAVTLMFTKESARQGADKRPQTQPCFALYAGRSSKWQDSEAMQTGLLGPLALISSTEMLGYDPESGSRPGPAARLEQRLVAKFRPVRC